MSDILEDPDDLVHPGRPVYVEPFDFVGEVTGIWGRVVVDDGTGALAAVHGHQVVCSTLHSQQRWQERFGPHERPDRRVMEAWGRGEELPESDKLSCEMARYDPETGAVMPAEWNDPNEAWGVTTVMHADWSARMRSLIEEAGLG